MTEPEAQALLLAGLPGAATELGLGAAAASARLKMVASLPPAWREQADRVGQRLHIDAVDWYRTHDTPPLLRAVADAVWRGRQLSVQYESWRGVARHELEPLGLVLKAGVWYLLAQTVPQHTVRTYRLSQLHTLRDTGSSFKRPRGFDLARAWQVSSGRFEAGLRTLQARVRVSPRGLSWLQHERVQAVVLPAHPGRRGDRPDWREVLMAMESVEHGARQLLAYGAEIEVLEPPALRTQVLHQATRLVALHQQTAGDAA